jgi:hypothetical protein
MRKSAQGHVFANIYVSRFSSGKHRIPMVLSLVPAVTNRGEQSGFLPIPARAGAKRRLSVTPSTPREGLAKRPRSLVTSLHMLHSVTLVTSNVYTSIVQSYIVYTNIQGDPNKALTPPKPAIVGAHLSQQIGKKEVASRKGMKTALAG